LPRPGRTDDALAGPSCRLAGWSDVSHACHALADGRRALAVRRGRALSVASESLARALCRRAAYRGDARQWRALHVLADGGRISEGDLSGNDRGAGPWFVGATN